MKKLMSILLSVVMLTVMATQVAFAEGLYTDTVDPGEDVIVTGFEDSKGNVQNDSWDTEYNTVTKTFSKNGNYVERVY
ncbi:MAG: hypothetical protein RR461_06845, partial [Angelakisella sp.]